MKKRCLCGTIVFKDTGELGGFFRCSECATEGGVAGWLAENQDKIDLKKLPTEAELMKKIFGKIT